MPKDLCIVVPTMNEVENIRPLIERVSIALEGFDWEIVFVDDDSTDGTAEEILKASMADRHVRFLERIGRRGLASACVEGMLSSNAPHLAVMDADLQHDESLLPVMLKTIRDENLDVVIASRFLAGSRIDGLSGEREKLSRVGTRICNIVIGENLSDPLSGFFMLRRVVLHEVAHTLALQGFKILVDIFASSKHRLKYKELPMHFRARHAGESKLDTLVTLEFLYVLADKLIGKLIPIRFVVFVLVGLFGVFVHLLILGALFRVAELPFYIAQAVATYSAMTLNYYFNNIFTYRDRRLRGRAFVFGLLSFYLICSIGALANVQIAEFVFELGAPWPIAGFLGAVVGSVWNYGVSSTFTWRKQARGATSPIDDGNRGTGLDQ